MSGPNDSIHSHLLQVVSKLKKHWKEKKKEEFIDASPQQQQQLYSNLYHVNVELREKVGHVLSMISQLSAHKSIDGKTLSDLLHLGIITVGTLHMKDDVAYIEKLFYEFFEKNPALKKT